MSTLFDPFTLLAIDKELVCHFFGVFSRFEFAMKENGFIRSDRGGAALPAWRKLMTEASQCISVKPDTPLETAVRFLNDNPPQVQNYHRGWDNQSLVGDTDIERALDASRRVRNNLFHGGKHPPYSPAGRDQKLVEASLVLIAACLDNMDNIRSSYESDLC